MIEALAFVLVLAMILLAILILYMLKMNWDFMNHILPRLENVELCFLGVKRDLEDIKDFETLVKSARAVARVSDSDDSLRTRDVVSDDDDDDDVVPKVIEKIAKKRKNVRRKE